MTQSRELDVAGLPLSGRHLIEASAGTGKTFNITRLYLRLLLEKQLSVQQILVMTFTKAATEEIRGRLSETVNEAIEIWQQFVQGDATATNHIDPVYQVLLERSDPVEALARLKAAQLEMDEAAVFTIHGFCQHVLTLMSFEASSAMNQELISDNTALLLEAVEDWIRVVAVDPIAYGLLTDANLHEPEAFLDVFKSAICSGLAPCVLSEQEIESDVEGAYATLRDRLAPRKRQIRDQLLNDEPLICERLIDGHKERDRRQQEWQVLLQWLAQDTPILPPKAVGEFVNGRRINKLPDMVAVFEPLKQLINEIKNDAKKCEAEAESMRSECALFRLIEQGFAFIRRHIDRAKKHLNILDFDDLIKQLAKVTVDADSALVKDMRARFPAALIDEFQDTDANQYQILDKVYPRAHPEHVLMMIGDPKQAIYAFRGGDIFTYLEASRQADHTWYMNTNWRSVSGMVNAYNTLFSGPQSQSDSDNSVFGYGIAYQPVQSTPKAKAASTPLIDADASRQALTYFYLGASDASRGNKVDKQRVLANWVGQEIHRLLNQATLADQPVSPRDIAILVRTSKDAALVKAVLAEVGLSAVYLSNKQSLFASVEAADLYRVLNGIWHVNDAKKLSVCISSPLFGYSHKQAVDLLHHEDASAWDEFMERVSTLKTMWLQRGCMSVILHLLQYHFTRVQRSSERSLTNYMHLAEVIEKQAIGQSRSEQLLRWLYHSIHHPDSSDEMIQRLETDAQLIQIVTQHGSKGLEYPIVFVPFANYYSDPSRPGNKRASVFQFYDEQRRSQILQLGRSFDAERRVIEEGEAESVRLLYVAITRAAQRCYLGMADFGNHERSALAKTLGQNGPSCEAMIEAIETMTKQQNACSAALTVDENALPVGGRIEPHTEQMLNVATFRSTVQDNWRLHSFSSLTRVSHAVYQTQRDQEINQQNEYIAEDTASSSALRFAFERGARAGNLLHDMLEHQVFGDSRWDDSVIGLPTRYGFDPSCVAPLTQWLDEVLASPLNPDGTLTLASLDETRILKEAEFYFPLDTIDMHQLEAVLNAHRQALSDTCEPVTATLGRHQIAGMMHGFIDLLFEHQGKYYVADYKSTWLGNGFSHYRKSALCQNNQQHLYDLQYLIYSLALHRYLSLTLPNYEFATHFGGVYYLYLRGMHPANQENEGVFYTAIEGQLIEQLDLLMGKHNEECVK